ncbi:hypothetical protein OURE66S_04542 [Oligella ureolytica]
MHISSKFSFYVMLILITPFYLNLNYVLSLWLGNVPEYAAVFISYLMIVVLIEVLSNSLMIGLQATGDVKLYQLTVGAIVFLNFPLVYLVYSLYALPELAFVVLDALSVLSLYVRLLFVKKQMGYGLYRFYKGVMLNITLVLMVSLPIVMFVSSFNNASGLLKVLADVVLCVVVFVSWIYLLGMNRYEKEFIVKTIKEKVVKHGTN